jgi:hypothetical protein
MSYHQAFPIGVVLTEVLFYIYNLEFFLSTCCQPVIFFANKGVYFDFKIFWPRIAFVMSEISHLNKGKRGRVQPQRITAIAPTTSLPIVENNNPGPLLEC